MLLKSVQLKGRTIPLAKPGVTKGANAVTVIMGNNGSGKSYLFQNICFAFIKVSYKNNFRYELNNFSNIPKKEELDDITYLSNDISYSISKPVHPFVEKYKVSNDEVVTLVSHYPYETVININETNDGGSNQQLMEYFLTEVKNQSQKLICKKNSQLVDFKDLVFPCKILGITGSPYDKFPFLERRPHLKLTIPYVYLGTRSSDISGARLKRSYLSNKFDQLGASFIKLLLKPKRKYIDFSKVFNYLNISNTFTLKLILSERFRVEDVEKNKILNMIRSIKFF
ncbi:ATP-binding cassette domain-containing protein [Pseudoalteromonas sp. SaAl2]